MEYLTLREISKNNKGYYGIGASSCPYNSNYPQYLRITDISDDGFIPFILPTSINPKKYPDYKNYYLRKNDIVFARTGNSTGRNYFFDKDNDTVVFAGFLIKFSLMDNLINPKYVKYYCQSQSYQNQIEEMFTGSTRKNINAEQYAELKIPLVPRELQQHIVNTIGSVDDLIENYNNQINLLRAFGNQKYRQLNFVYSEPIKQFFTFVKGKEVGSKNYLTENSKQATPYIRVGNLLSGQYDTFVEDDEIVASNDDILIAFDGAPGRNNIGLHGAYSSGIYKVVSSEIYKGIIYFYLNSEYCQNVIKVNSQGTTILHAGKAIKELLFPQEISEACLDEFNLIFRQIIDLIEKRNILLEQKKLLLAKYFE